MSELICFRTEGCPEIKVPAWKRAGFFDEETGVVYVPAAMGMGSDREPAVVMMAIFDGVSLVQDRGHVYVPSWWMAKTWPDTAEVLTNSEKRVREMCKDG